MLIHKPLSIQDVTSFRNFWTQEQDNEVISAIAQYNRNNSTVFPQTPFEEKLVFTKIKPYLPQSFLKDYKQIRERYVNTLSPKVRHYIAEEDVSMILELCKETNNSWTKVAKLIYRHHFKEMYYYSDNAIKNLYHQRPQRALSTSSDSFKDTSDVSNSYSKKRKRNSNPFPVLSTQEEQALIRAIIEEK